MAAKLSQSLEDQVTCPICLDQYQDPRILPCLHTYCRKCLQGLLEEGSRKFSIQCPECRKIVKVNDVSSLQVNIWVNKNLSLIELVKKENQSHKDGELQCGNCNLNERAVARCFDCETFMCDNCIKAHKLMAFLKNHNLLTLEEIKNSGVPSIDKPTICHIHNGNKQELFCTECEVLICKYCTMTNHKDHEFAFIPGVIEDYKVKLQMKIEEVCRRKKKVEYALKAVKETQESIRGNEESIKKEIDEKINAQIAVLEQKRTSLKQESAALMTKEKEKFSLRHDDLEMHLAVLTSAVEFTENILAKGTSSDVLSMVKQIGSRLSEVSEKEIDGEVDKRYEQILQFNQIPYGDIDNSIVIKVIDRFVPDLKNCTLDWIPDTDSIGLQVRNYLNEPVDIKTDRIQINCPIQCECHKTGKGEFIIEGLIRNPNRELPMDTYSYTECLEVMIDGVFFDGYLYVASQLDCFPENVFP